MALNNLVDSRDVRFVLFEMLDIEKLTINPKFAEHDRDTFESTLQLAEQIAAKSAASLTVKLQQQNHPPQYLQGRLQNKLLYRDKP